MSIGVLRKITVTPTVDTAVYAALDQVSTLQTLDRLFPPRRGGEIVLITVLDKGVQSVALDLFFFSGSVTVAADNAAFTISDTDMEKCLGVVNVLAADYDAVASANSIATIQLKFPIVFNTANDRLFMAIKAIGAPDYVGASDLVINLTAESRE